MTQSLHCLDFPAENDSPAGTEIDRLYAGELDVVIVRQALNEDAVDQAVLAMLGPGATDHWNRPNLPVPIIDLRLLGIGAAPCATMPRGPAAEEYLAAAAETPGAIRKLFGDAFDPFLAIERQFQLLSGRPATVPLTADQRPFSPCTVRAIPEGAGLMVHHDNHYQLPVYDQVREQFDTSLLLSFFVVLHQPEIGGRLCIYSKGPQDDAELPKLDNGQPDPVAFDALVPHEYFDLRKGDMILFASSRLYHTVELVGGPLPRITMGGFAALDANHESCRYWS